MAHDYYIKGIKGNKVFGGKRYEYHNSYATKADAQEYARLMRSKGWDARVAPLPKYSLRPGVKYAIYVGPWSKPR